MSSYLYAYLNIRKLKQDWAFLVQGQKRCVGGSLHRGDNQVVHAQRAWARKGDGTVVSVMVTRMVDKAGAEQSPSLPVDAKALTVKVAAE